MTRYRISIPTGPHSTHILYRADAAEFNRALQFHVRRDTWVRVETYQDDCLAQAKREPIT